MEVKNNFTCFKCNVDLYEFKIDHCGFHIILKNKYCFIGMHTSDVLSAYPK